MNFRVAEKDLLLHSQEAQIENLENKLKEFEGGNENPNKVNFIVIMLNFTVCATDISNCFWDKSK